MYGTGALRVSWGSPLAKGANVFRALGAHVIQGMALEASYDGEDG